MPFPVTYVLDQSAPSETFIRRELDQLRRNNWPVFTRLLVDDRDPLTFSLGLCPKRFRRSFGKAASARVAEELWRDPLAACRLIRRLPQAAHLMQTVVETDSRLIHAEFAGIAADLASVAARAMGLPWTCAVHAHDVFTGSPQALHRRLRGAAGIVACSRQAAEAVLAAGLPKEMVSIIRHGLPLGDYAFKHTPTDGTIFTACRLETKKGLDTLLDACALLAKRGLPFTCVIAGSGPCLEALKAQTKRLGLESAVSFTGWQSQEETRTRLRNAAVLALPSRRAKNGDRDGLANIVVEAMALGTPVITTAAGAAQEVIVHNENGILVPPDDPSALADALAEALAAKESLPRLAEAARQTAEACFDNAKNIVQLEAFFTRMAERPA